MISSRIAEGWGVIDGEQLITETITPTRIGTMTNWLLRERGALMRAGASDADIETLWKARHGDAVVVRVEIRVIEPAADVFAIANLR